MMPETIGQQLQNARLARGLTVDQVARVLHIRPIYLVALEEDRRKALPSLVQGKGFLRLYADHLGLPIQPLLDLWDGKAALPAPAPESAPDPAPLPPPAPVIPLPEPAPLPPKPIPDPIQKAQPPAPLINDEPGKAEPARPPSQAGSVFVDIGAHLKRQRQALNLSLAEVERYTHVRMHYLKALEEGSIEDLPSPVQGRGMLSNYAHFLNLDVDGLLLEFAEGLQSRRIERLDQGKPQKAPEKNGAKSDKQARPAKPRSRRLFSVDLLVSGVLVMIILGFALWTIAQVDALNTSKLGTATPPSIADVLLHDPTHTPAATGTATRQPLLSTLAPGEVGSSGGNSSGSSSIPGVTVTVPSGGAAPVQVYIIARQRAFLRVSVDDKVAFEGRVVPGSAYPYSGQKKIELLTGSAAALQVFFNQKDLGVLGQVGEVKSMIFSANSSITPTPQFTPTRTRTVAPSSTQPPTPTLPTPTITPFIP
jgi:cytoskeleton protein RodZ